MSTMNGWEPAALRGFWRRVSRRKTASGSARRSAHSPPPGIVSGRPRGTMPSNHAASAASSARPSRF